MTPSGPEGIERRVADLLDAHVEAMRGGRVLDPKILLGEPPEVAEAFRDALRGLDFVRGRTEGGEAPGRILGDFRIVREAGRGGMGVVYEAEQISLRRRVALKVLPFAGVLDPKQLQRFRNEAQAAAQLHHTNIVPVYQVGSERGVHFYAMQYIEGASLACAVADARAADRGESRRDPSSKSPLSSHGSHRRPEFQRAAARLALQAAEALDHAHQVGVVHRDVKPGNLMLDVGGNLWVTDFGLARFAQEASLTITGDLVGTLRYMSPEQALAGRAVVDHRTDVYSLGATFYEVVTLEPAVRGNDPQSVLREIVERDPVPPRRKNPAVPVELETILLKAMAKEPEGRYATAKDMADDLRRFLEGEPVVARRPGLLVRGGRWARRHKALVGAGVAALVLAVAGLAVAAIRISHERQVARAALDDAEASLDVAVHAVDEMLVEVGSNALADVPQAQDVRKRLLEKALALYREVMNRRGPDLRVRRRTAEAVRRVGEVQGSMGLEAEALRSFEESVAAWEVLLEEAPDEPSSLAQLALSHERAADLLLRGQDIAGAGSHQRRALALWRRLVARRDSEPQALNALGFAQNSLAGILRLEGDDAAALLATREAVTLQEDLVRRFPDRDLYRRFLAAYLERLGTLTQGADPPSEAEACFRRAVELRRLSLAEDPGAALRRETLAVALGQHASHHQGVGRNGEASTLLAEATALLEGLVDDFPRVVLYREHLLWIHNERFLALCAEGRHEDAVASVTGAIAAGEWIAARFPAVARHRWTLASLHGNRGVALQRLGHLPDAEVAYRRQFDLLRTLAHETSPLPSRETIRVTQSGVGNVAEVPDYREHAGGVCETLGDVLRRNGKYAEAREVFEAGVELDPENPGRKRDLARFLADCPDPAFRDLDRALTLLRSAIERAKDGGPTGDWDAARLWTALGMAQVRAGNLEEASNALEKAVDLRTSPEEERYWLAMVQWRRGNRESARESYAIASAWRKRVFPHADDLRLGLDAEVAALLELPPPAD